jgi:uncharacterized protein YggE
METIVPKGLVWGIGSLLIIFLVFASVQKGYDVSQTFRNANPKNTISVSAEGKVSAVPDLATINLGVLSQGATPTTVQEENTNKINKIIDFVKKEGIDKDDVQTSQFNVYPTQDYRDGKSIITGYQVSQTITIKVREIDKNSEKIGKILSGVTEQGANQINGVYLSFDDPDQLRGEAREKAISKAKQKAEELAKAAGITLGRIVNLSESFGGGYPAPYYADSGMGGAGIAYEKAASPNIEPGNQDVIVNMNLEFEIK